MAWLLIHGERLAVGGSQIRASRLYTSGPQRVVRRVVQYRNHQQPLTRQRVLAERVGFEPTVRLESSASASTDWSANSEARHTQSTSADLTLQRPRLHLFILRTSASSSSRSSAPNQARMTTSDAADKRSPFCPSIILTKARGYFRQFDGVPRCVTTAYVSSRLDPQRSATS